MELKIEQKKYIEKFTDKFLIKERNGKKKKSGKKKESQKKEEIKNVNEETISLSLNKLNELFEINKIEKEDKIRKSIEHVLNEYLSKNEIFSDNYNWYEEVLENNCWDIINYLPDLE